MAGKNTAGRVTAELAELTGMSDHELRLVLTGVAAAGLVVVAIRTLTVLVNLGSNVLGARPRQG